MVGYQCGKCVVELIVVVGHFDIFGRGRLAWTVVDTPYLSFAGAVSRPGSQLLVEGVRVVGFEVPHVDGAAALGSSLSRWNRRFPFSNRVRPPLLLLRLRPSVHSSRDLTS